MPWLSRNGRYTLLARIFHVRSVRSAINELESDLITNKVRHLDFVKLLGYLSQLAERDSTILGGPEACQQFNEAKKAIRIFHIFVLADCCQEYLSKLGG